MFGPVVATAQEVYVPEFGPRLGGGVTKAVGQRDLVGFVQAGQALFIQAAERVDQRLGEHEPRTDAQPRRAGTVGEPRGGPQRGDPGLDDAGRHRGRSGLDDRLDRGVAGHFTGRVPGLAHGRLNGGTGSHAELGAQSLRARGELPGRGAVVAGHPVQPDQQGLVVLVERAHRGGTDGIADGRLERASRHRPQGGLVQDGLGRGGRVPLLGEQPRLEGRRVLDRHALEQVRAQPGQAHGIHPGPLDHHLDVYHRVRREPKRHRVTVDRSLFPQRAPDLSQAPPQRPGRVVGAGEQQGSELAAAGRALAEDQVRQQRPALAAPEPVDVPRAPGDARRAKELDGGAHRLRMVAWPGPRGPPVRSRPSRPAACPGAASVRRTAITGHSRVHACLIRGGQTAACEPRPGGRSSADPPEQLPHQDLLVVDGSQRPGGAAGVSASFHGRL